MKTCGKCEHFAITDLEGGGTCTAPVPEHLSIHDTHPSRAARSNTAAAGCKMFSRSLRAMVQQKTCGNCQHFGNNRCRADVPQYTPDGASRVVSAATPADSCRAWRTVPQRVEE